MKEPQLGSQEYEAVRILDEKGPAGPSGKYLIEWANDPNSSQPYEPSWEGKNGCNDELVKDWKERKAADPGIVGQHGGELEENVMANENELKSRKRRREQTSPEEEKVNDMNDRKARKPRPKAPPRVRPGWEYIPIDDEDPAYLPDPEKLAKEARRRKKMLKEGTVDTVSDANTNAQPEASGSNLRQTRNRNVSKPISVSSTDTKTPRGVTNTPPPRSNRATPVGKNTPTVSPSIKESPASNRKQPGPSRLAPQASPAPAGPVPSRTEEPPNAVPSPRVIEASHTLNSEQVDDIHSAPSRPSAQSRKSNLPLMPKAQPPKEPLSLPQDDADTPPVPPTSKAQPTPSAPPKDRIHTSDPPSAGSSRLAAVHVPTPEAFKALLPPPPLPPNSQHTVPVSENDPIVPFSSPPRTSRPLAPTQTSDNPSQSIASEETSSSHVNQVHSVPTASNAKDASFSRSEDVNDLHVDGALLQDGDGQSEVAAASTDASAVEPQKAYKTVIVDGEVVYRAPSSSPEEDDGKSMRDAPAGLDILQPVDEHIEIEQIVTEKLVVPLVASEGTSIVTSKTHEATVEDLQAGLIKTGGALAPDPGPSRIITQSSAPGPTEATLQTFPSQTAEIPALKLRISEMQALIDGSEDAMRSKDAEIALLKKSLKKARGTNSSLNDDLRFIQDQYNNASNSAVDGVEKVKALEEKVKTLQGQLTLGLKQRDLVKDGVRAKLAEEAKKLRMVNKVLLDQARLTDDLVRKKASAYGPLRKDKEHLAQMHYDLLRQIEDLKSRNEELRDQVAHFRAREMGVFGDPETETDGSGSDDDGESSPAGGMNPAELGYTTGSPDIMTRPRNFIHSEIMPSESQLISTQEAGVHEEDDGGVGFWCKWRTTDRCNLMYDTLEAYKSHIRSEHVDAQ